MNYYLAIESLAKLKLLWLIGATVTQACVSTTLKKETVEMLYLKWDLDYQTDLVDFYVDEVLLKASFL